MTTKIKKKSDRVLRAQLHKAYLKLLKRTFKFIKLYYIKDRSINPKRDPELYGSLVCECSLSDLKKKDNFLRKLFLKLQQCEFYEDYLIPREILQLLFMPCFRKVEYYLLLQHHVLENGAALQIDLQNYFDYVQKEFKIYIFCIEKTYKVKKLLTSNRLYFHMRSINRKTKDFIKKRPIKAKYQEVDELKHLALTIQLLFLKEISEAETKKRIKNACYHLTSFLFRSDELFCGYV